MTVSERRLRFLNETFRTGKSFTKKELEVKVSRYIAPFRNRQEINDNSLDISKRTIDYDIKKLREEFKAPLVCLKGRYYYTNSKFTIEKPDIDSEALQNIKIAAEILKQIPGLGLDKDLMDIYERLDTIDTQSGNERTYVQFDTRPAYDGKKHFIRSLEACKIGSVISFDYQPFMADKLRRIILHPYLLKEYNNRWFLIGKTEEGRKQKKKEISQFGLERIIGKIKNENIPFSYDPDFNPEEYLANVIGVSMKTGAVIEDIILRFTSPRAKYIETNPLHFSQKLLPEQKSKEYTTFTYRLIPNRELETMILSFGRDVQVIKPENLRQSIVKNVDETFKSYS